MSKIIKNTTNNDIEISDVGLTIPANSNYTIQTTDYLLWAGSGDVIVEISSGNFIINDGSFDLAISEGVDLIKGLYPKKISIDGVGLDGDSLKVKANVQTQEITLDPSSTLVDTSFNKVDLNRDYQNYNTIYNYSGSGKFYSFTVDFNSDKVLVEFSVDGHTIFSVDCDELESISDSEYGSAYSRLGWLSWNKQSNTLKFEPKYALRYTTSVEIKAKANSNSGSRDMTGYLVDMVKES